MSMAMKWRTEDGQSKQVTAPLSLIVTAFAPVTDIRQTWTPQLIAHSQETILVFVDLALGRRRLGGSALAQVYKQIGSEPPDVDEPAVIKSFFGACQTLKKDFPSLVLAYHDRSDGGLYTTLAEMCFAGRIGATISLDALPGVSTSEDIIDALFAEELGAVLQIQTAYLGALSATFVRHGFPTRLLHVIGQVNQDPKDQSIQFVHQSEIVFQATREDLQAAWAETSFQMQTIRDDPTCAAEEYALIKEPSRGLFYELGNKVQLTIPQTISEHRPKVAILREQGVNGHVEMAWAFHAAGFASVDVHMSDLLSGATTLSDFRGIAACGGFSYGDVLGAGNGWAKSILLHSSARQEFEAFFQRTDTFALAVCNGCQLFGHLKDIIPGASAWPAFKQNRSQRFEARTCMVEVIRGDVTRKSVFLRDMVGAKLPVAVAHGEGRATFDEKAQQDQVSSSGLEAVRYVDHSGKFTEHYPLNPNGSPGGLTGVQTPDGRVLALMPHPERVVTAESNSWYPSELSAEQSGVGPWFQMFRSAREWCT
ncbi:hypothetical protein FRB90_006038 [Tulasnella sp. 427]|nr:hypothetical protein FRB90_006038 [Tulasnella sp. 427]